MNPREQLWKCSVAERSCVVKVNVMSRAELCPVLQAWGGLFVGETLKFLELFLRKVKKKKTKY